MSWVKLDDGFFRNTKVVGISAESRLIYLAGLCYASASLSDGTVPKGAVKILAAEAGVASTAKRIRELVEAGLWVENPDGYAIHDYLEHNSSAEDVRSKKDAAKERMQRRRSQNVRANKERTSREVREPDTDTDTELTTTNVVVGPQAPATQDPEPVEEKPKPKRATQISPDWQVSDHLREWAHGAGYTDADLAQEAPKFRDHWLSKGEPRKDWDAGFRMWMANAKQYGHLFAKPKQAGPPPNLQTDSYRGDDESHWLGQYAQTHGRKTA